MLSGSECFLCIPKTYLEQLSEWLELQIYNRTNLGVVVGCCGSCGTGCKDVTKLKLWFNQEKLNYQRSPEIII